MGKNHKHKKVLKSEKAKVKLKGKKLPKDTNVTDTNFKIRKIVIHKQLEANEENDLLTKRKLNLKDLITRLRHYNVTSRTDALVGIKELITNYSVEILTKHLNELLENVPRLALDIERSVRHECFKVLTLILNPIPTLKIAPFFELMTSYLCCAMTHINQNIQEDSLLFIDILITATPSLVAKHYMKILPNFLNLISRIHSDSKIDRKLTVNLNSKQTSVKWRIKVLFRLQNLLKSIASERQNSKTHSFTNTIRCMENGAVYNSNYLRTCNLKCLNAGVVNNGNTELQNLGECVNSIMPLLLETWLENKPTGDNFEFESLITEEAAEILQTILIIIKLLINLIELYEESYNDKTLKKEFINKFESSFVKYFLEKFPYSKTESTVKQVLQWTSSSTCHDQNILIVYLFFEFRKRTHQNIHDEAVFEYIKRCLPLWSTFNKETSSHMEVILQNCLLKSTKIKYDMDSVVRVLVKYFVTKRSSLENNLKDSIFKILCELLENEKLSRSVDYQKGFLRLLPHMLGKEQITIPILTIVATLCRRNNTDVIKGIIRHLPDIIGNLEQMQLNQLPDECENTPFELLNQILYYIKRDQ